jgi:O-antigen/teichoic acid export membrane protein
VTGQAVSLHGLWAAFRTKLIARKFVRDVGVLTIANGVAASLSFMQAILVARWLGPELYGVAALVMGYPGIVHTFLDARSAEASVKYLSEFDARGERDRIIAMCKLGFVVDIAIAALMFLIVVVTAHWAAQRMVHCPDALGLIIVYAAAFLPRALIGTSYAVLATLGRFSLIAFLDLLTIAIRVTFVLGGLLLGEKVSAVIWGNTASLTFAGLAYVVVAMILALRVWGALPWQGDWQTLTGRRGQIFRFLAYNNLSTLLGIIPKQLDVILLGYFRGPTEVGYYKLARNLAGAVTYLVRPLQSVIYPELSRLWGAEERKALWQKVRRLAIYIGAPVGVAVLAGTLLIPLALPVLVGHDYSPAVGVTQLLLFGSAVWLAFFWLRPLYFAIGQIRQWTFGISAYSMMFLLLSILTVHEWGTTGIALSLVIVTVLFHVCMGILIYGTNRHPRKSV